MLQHNSSITGKEIMITAFHPPSPLHVTPRRTRVAATTSSSSPSKLLFSCSASVSSKSPSRRKFLQFSLLSSIPLIFQSPVSTHAYSSPYRPGEDATPLPDRLYEKPDNAIVKTNSGLQYFDLATGNGNSTVNAGDTVVVNYTSRLRGLNGIKIDSSFESDRPFVFQVGAKDVVPGVSEAVQGMRVGGKRRAVLPPQIAYSSPDMRPAVTEFFARRRLLSVLETNRDATIVFDLELLKIK